MKRDWWNKELCEKVNIERILIALIKFVKPFDVCSYVNKIYSVNVSIGNELWEKLCEVKLTNIINMGLRW